MPIPRSSNKCPLCGGLGFYTYDVPPGHPEFGRAIPCDCLEPVAKARQLAGLVELAGLKGLEGMTFETFREIHQVAKDGRVISNRSALRAAQAFAENPQGWLLIMGRTGRGKTHLLAAIGHECLARGQLVVYASTPDLLDHLRATFEPGSRVGYEERLRALREVEVLLLDDLGAERDSGWGEEKVWQLLNWRYERRLPTAITTNVAIADFPPRLVSRLGDVSLVRQVIITCDDYRLRRSDRGSI